MKLALSAMYPACRICLDVCTLMVTALVISSCVMQPAHALLPEETPDFSQIESIEARKTAFFDYLLPQIDERNREILQNRRELISLFERRGKLSNDELAWIGHMAVEYEVDGFDITSDTHWQVLLRRVDIVPPSLALAQAANESAWGTSRFARQGENYFGQWCFVQGCGIVPLKRPDNAIYEVENFESARHSVERYMHNLNHHPAYMELRLIRASLRSEGKMISGMALAEGLKLYSARGMQYVKMIRAIISANDLITLDARA